MLIKFDFISNNNSSSHCSRGEQVKVDIINLLTVNRVKSHQWGAENHFKKINKLTIHKHSYA